MRRRRRSHPWQRGVATTQAPGTAFALWLPATLNSAPDMKNIMTQINWVDFLTVLVLIVGIFRGRRRGFSQEMLDTTQWLLIILAGGFLYARGGQWLASNKIFGLLTCYLATYLVIALAVKITFSFIKRTFGEKIVEKNFFGSAEYYLGMGAGAVRFACVFLFFLNLLHAKYISPEEIAAEAKYQEKNFGDISFPTLGSMQQEVYKKSFTGRTVHRYLTPVLITPTASTTGEVRGENSMGKRREQEIDQVMGRK